MKNKVMETMAVCAVVFACSAQAQQRITIDIRGHVVMPVEKLAGAELGTGLGFGGTVAVRVQQHVHVYGGWDWLHFNPEASFAGADLDFEETGYVFGLRFDHPVRAGSGVTFRLEGGGTFKHVEIEGNAGEGLVDSGHSLGFEFGGGFTVPLAASWKLAPAVRFRLLSPEFEIDDTTTSGKLRYVAFELGVSKRF